MKRIVKMFAIGIIFCILGCGKKEYTTCTIKVNNLNQNYTFNAEYKIYYNKTFVTKIEKEEIYKSNYAGVIDYLKASNELNYNNLNDLYGGYDYSIDSDKTSLTIKTTIDTSNVDFKSMVQNGEISSDYVISNKLTISGAKYLYKEKGATCDT